MRAGFSEIDITPKELGRLGRLIAAPTQVQAVHLPLYARLAVFDDGSCRVAILSLDMNFMFSQNVPEVREAIAAAGDIEPENVMVTCTHTHNSFPTTPWHEEDGFRSNRLSEPRCLRRWRTGGTDTFRRRLPTSTAGTRPAWAWQACSRLTPRQRSRGPPWRC